MKIFVIGGGGREHAIIWKLANDSSRPELFCAPGNAGIGQLAKCIPIAADDVQNLLNWAQVNRPDLTIVGPEAPLCAGIVDKFEQEGLAIFGPCQAAARLEGSKCFAKEVMVAANVPTAKYQSFFNAADALAALPEFSLPVVIKADGLAAGKGVIIANNYDEAKTAVNDMLIESCFGAAGHCIVIEEFLQGEEASILALVDGNNIVMLPAAQDHKRVGDNDTGSNTGGMGAYAPAPLVTPDLYEKVKNAVILPVLSEMRRRGIIYRGVLYAGLMIYNGNPKVLEFNCRFGDPETEALMPLIEGDLLPVLQACITGNLQSTPLKIKDSACVTVMMAAEGYPGSYRKGTVIEGLSVVATLPDTVVFHAGTAKENDKIISTGGRVLAVTATDKNLQAAVQRVYKAIKYIEFSGSHYRTDIARKAFKS